MAKADQLRAPLLLFAWALRVNDALDNLVFALRGDRIVPDRSLHSSVEAALAEAEKANHLGDDGNIGVGRGGGAAD